MDIKSLTSQLMVKQYNTLNGIVVSKRSNCYLNTSRLTALVLPIENVNRFINHSDWFKFILTIERFICNYYFYLLHCIKFNNV